MHIRISLRIWGRPVESGVLGGGFFSWKVEIGGMHATWVRRSRTHTSFLLALQRSLSHLLSFDSGIASYSVIFNGEITYTQSWTLLSNLAAI